MRKKPRVYTFSILRVLFLFLFVVVVVAVVVMSPDQSMISWVGKAYSGQPIHSNSVLNILDLTTNQPTTNHWFTRFQAILPGISAVRRRSPEGAIDRMRDRRRVYRIDGLVRRGSFQRIPLQNYVKIYCNFQQK